MDLKNLTISFTVPDLTTLANVVLALKQAGVSPVVGGGAAVPTANPSDPAPVVQMAAPAPTSAAPAPTGAPAIATASPSESGALDFMADVMGAYKAHMPRAGADNMTAANQQFGITSPLQLKTRPQDWAGYIATLAALPAKAG